MPMRISLKDYLLFKSITTSPQIQPRKNIAPFIANILTSFVTSDFMSNIMNEVSH